VCWINETPSNAYIEFVFRYPTINSDTIWDYEEDKIATAKQILLQEAKKITDLCGLTVDWENIKLEISYHC
jgi:hypothetical protein